MKIILKPTDRSIVPIFYRQPDGKQFCQYMGGDWGKLEIEIPDGSVLFIPDGSTPQGQEILLGDKDVVVIKV